MNPVLDYHSNEPPTLRGYRARQQARVTVSELRKAGKAIAAAVDVGANNARVKGISLGLPDVEAVLDEAREAAVGEATAKAEQYAQASGQSLGEVLTLREVTSQPEGPEQDYSASMDVNALRSAARVPIRAGEDELSVQVEVVWEFE